MYKISSIKELRRYEFSLQEIDAIIGPTIEKYYKDGSDDKSQQEEVTEDSYVTEICIPIAPAKKKGEKNEHKRSNF